MTDEYNPQFEILDALNKRISIARDFMSNVQQENEVYHNFFGKLAQMSSNSQYSPFLEYCNNKNVQLNGVPGFPGTQYNILACFSEGLDSIHVAFFAVCKMVADSFHRDKFKGKSHYEGKLDLKNLEHISGELINLKKFMYSAYSAKKDKKISKALTKLEDLSHSYNKKKQISKSNIKSLNDYYILMLPEKKDYEKQKKWVVNTAKSLFYGIVEGSTGTVESIRERNLEIYKKLTGIKSILNTYIESLEKVAFNIQRSCDFLDFRSDLSDFVKSKGIYRYQIHIPPFEEFVGDSDIFIEANAPSVYRPLRYDPVAIVEAIATYEPDARSNEIKIVRGKRYFLLEKLEKDWILIMNPKSRICGFAPSNFLKIIGRGLGVVLRVINPKDEMKEAIDLTPGEYVAVHDTETLSFETIQKDVCKSPPRNLIGITHYLY